MFKAKTEVTDNMSEQLQAADEFTNTSTLHSASELIEQLQSLRPASLEPGKEFTIGFVSSPQICCLSVSMFSAKKLSKFSNFTLVV